MKKSTSKIINNVYLKYENLENCKKYYIGGINENLQEEYYEINKEIFTKLWMFNFPSN